VGRGTPAPAPGCRGPRGRAGLGLLSCEGRSRNAAPAPQIRGPSGMARD